jgi:putative FmdB family regulatory protein
VPIYEYRCTKCGHRFEAIQKVSDAPLNKCEKCKGRAERLVSSPAIQFKGSGWYITDYARKAAQESTAESGKDGNVADSSKDGRPADKTASDKPAAEKPASRKTKEKAGSGAK